MSQPFHASWVQGNALVVENPSDDPGTITISHYGWGTEARMQPGVSQWFHIPIPTPVIVNNQRSRLLRVFLLYKLEGIASIVYLHLYDGGTLVTQYWKGFTNFFDGAVHIGGDHTSIDQKSTFEPYVSGKAAGDLYEVRYGLSLSFQVEVSAYGHGDFIPFSQKSVLTVIAAGADYISDPAPEPHVLTGRTSASDVIQTANS
jgi:hypothetical protein